MRYAVVLGNQANGYYDWAVVDTSRTSTYPCGYYLLAECIEEEVANQICAALNDQAQAAQRDNDLLTGA